MILGIILLFIGIILYFWVSSNVSKRRGDRPLAFSNTIFVLILSLFYLGLIITGLILIFRSSYKIGITIIIAVVLIFITIKWMSSPRYTRKTILKSYQKFKAFSPEENEEFILTGVIQARHPDYDEGRIISILENCKNIEELIEYFIYPDLFVNFTDDAKNMQGDKDFSIFY